MEHRYKLEVERADGKRYVIIWTTDCEHLNEVAKDFNEYFLGTVLSATKEIEVGV